jgi:hypothetical protein
MIENKYLLPEKILSGEIYNRKLIKIKIFVTKINKINLGSGANIHIK